MKPARGKLFVKRIDTQESLPDGKLLLLERTREDLTASQMEVVAVGALAYCTDFGTCQRERHLLCENMELSSADTVTADIFHQCDVEAGNWVLLAPRSLTETDDPTLFVCSQDAVLAILQP